MKKNDNILKKRTGLIVLLFLLMCGCVFTAIENSTCQAQAVSIIETKQELLKENESLNVNLLGSSSLVDIEGDAEKLGFVKPEKVVYLSKGDEFASVLQTKAQ